MRLTWVNCILVIFFLAYIHALVIPATGGYAAFHLNEKQNGEEK